MTHAGPSRAVRAWLRSELPRWREDGLVGEEAARELDRRYELDGRSGAPAVVFVIYLVGSLLIGGGILSFVAWNWDRLPGAAKLALGGSSLVAAYATGFWFWKVDGGRPLLGHALTVVGSLLFGANIGIVAQVYQLDGEWWQSAGLWAAGTALAAWLLASAPNGVLAGALGIFWSVPAIEHADAVWPAFLPLLVVVPLALRLDSMPVFLAAIAVTVVPLAASANEFGNRPVYVVYSLLASASLLMALPHLLPGRWKPFGAVSASIGLLAVVALAYVLSFHEAAEEMGRGSGPGLRWTAGVVPQAAAVVVALAWLLRRPEEIRRRGPGAIVGLGAAALLLAGMLFPEPEVPLAILANLSLALVGGYAIVSSMHFLQRYRYWSGATMLGVVIVTRFFEYESGLLVKAAVFTACGVAVILSGIAFERRLSAREVSRAA